MIAEKDIETSKNTAKRYKIVVRSAEEAVRLIREKLGEKAKVVSVRQVGGEGLKRFISSPKLEVIAEVKNEDEDEVLPQTEDKNTLDSDALDAVSPSLASSESSNIVSRKKSKQTQFPRVMKRLIHHFLLNPYLLCLVKQVLMINCFLT